MSAHHFIDISSVLIMNQRQMIAAFAALRTQYYPEERRFCCPFMRAWLDYAYVQAFFLAVEGMHYTNVHAALENYRLGSGSLEQLADTLLGALGLRAEGIYEDLSLSARTQPSSSSLPYSYLAYVPETLIQTQKKHAVAHVERALHAQLQVNLPRIEDLKAFLRTHAAEPVTFVNAGLFSDNVFICHLLRQHGIPIFACVNKEGHLSQKDEAEKARLADKEHVFYLHSTAHHGAYPQHFIRELALSRPYYHSTRQALVDLMRRAGIEADLAFVIPEHPLDPDHRA